MKAKDITAAKQFTRVFQEEDGYTRTWYYDTTKYGINPYKVEIEYPKSNEVLDNSKLSKTKRKYLNPINGKMVGYARARGLGLIN